MVMIERFTSPQEFLEKGREYLQRNEAACNQIIGFARRLCGKHSEEGSPYLALVCDGPQVEGVALWTGRGRNLLVSDLNESHYGLLADDVRASSAEPVGVVAAGSVAREFAGLLRPGAAWQRTRSLASFELRAVTPPRPSPGEFRPAEESDLESVADWIIRFSKDVGEYQAGWDPTPRLKDLLEERAFFIWQDPEPVSCAAITGRTLSGVRISFVYTPERFRGRGYASNCVAAVSKNALGSGALACYLFTDLANPTSNSIYPKIGYRHVCDFEEVKFE